MLAQRSPVDFESCVVRTLLMGNMCSGLEDGGNQGNNLVQLVKSDWESIASARTSPERNMSCDGNWWLAREIQT